MYPRQPVPKCVRHLAVLSDEKTQRDRQLWGGHFGPCVSRRRACLEHAEEVAGYRAQSSPLAPVRCRLEPRREFVRQTGVAAGRDPDYVSRPLALRSGTGEHCCTLRAAWVRTRRSGAKRGSGSCITRSRKNSTSAGITRKNSAAASLAILDPGRRCVLRQGGDQRGTRPTRAMSGLAPWWIG